MNFRETRAAEEERRRKAAEEAALETAEEEARLQAAEEEAKRAAEEAARLESEARLQADRGRDSIKDLILEDQRQSERQNDGLPFGGLDIESIIRKKSGDSPPNAQTR